MSARSPINHSNVNSGNSSKVQDNPQDPAEEKLLGHQMQKN